MFNIFNFLRKKDNLENIGHGLIKSPIDTRDYLLSAVSFIPQRIPKEFPPTFDLTVKSQGGTPHCFPSNTLVLRENFEWEKINKIKKGDYLFTHTGRTNKVTKLFKRRWQGTMVGVELVGDYESIVSTSEHPYYSIKRKNKPKEGHPEWIEAKKLEKGDYIALLSTSNYHKDTTINSYEKDPDFLWLLGIYLAEGNLHRKEVQISLSLKEKDIANRIQKIISKYGGETRIEERKEVNTLLVNITNEWRNIFKELGSEYSDGKKINKRLMFLEPSLQMNIIKGWLDGDGSFLGKEIVGVSVSEELIKQIRLLLLRNKIFSRIRKRRERKDRKDAWEIYINKDNFKGKKCKNECGFWRGEHYFTRIREIKKIPQYYGENVYNLEVENDNSYVVNYTPVHNCAGFAASTIKEDKELRERNQIVFDGHWIYHECKKIDNYDGDGTFLRIAMKVLQKEGAKPEDGGDPEQFRIGSYALVDDDSFEGLKKAYVANGTYLIGFRGSNQGWKTAYVRPPKSGESVWGHALAVVGYTENYIIVHNSWGTKGDNGLYYIPKGYEPMEAWVVLTDLPTEIDEGLIGWVAEMYIQDNKVTPTVGLRLRQGSGLEHKTLKVLPLGTEVEPLGERVYNSGYWWIRVRVR